MCDFGDGVAEGAYGFVAGELEGEEGDVGVRWGVFGWGADGCEDVETWGCLDAVCAIGILRGLTFGSKFNGKEMSNAAWRAARDLLALWTSRPPSSRVAVSPCDQRVSLSFGHVDKRI